MASAEDLTALLPVTWNLCERSPSLDGALSVHSGRKSENDGAVVSSWFLWVMRQGQANEYIGAVKRAEEDARGATFVEVAGRGEDVERLGVLLAEALLALEEADLERVGRSVVLARELDRVDRALRRVRVDERVLGPRGEGLPLGLGVDALERLGDLVLELLHLAQLDLALVVVGLAGGLDLAGDALLKLGLLLLETDHGRLEVVWVKGADTPSAPHHEGGDAC